MLVAAHVWCQRCSGTGMQLGGSDLATNGDLILSSGRSIVLSIQSIDLCIEPRVICVVETAGFYHFLFPRDQVNPFKVARGRNAILAQEMRCQLVRFVRESIACQIC